jgi:hypothetical protein
MRSTKRIVSSIVAGLVVTACGNKDESTGANPATDPASVSSGDQPDSESGRFTPPADVTAPTVPSAFAVAGGDKLGDVDVLIGYPENIDDYAKIDIRRATGETPPASCDSGTLVQSVTDFSVQKWTDSGLYPGSVHSYLACIYDAAGNVIKTESLTKGRASDKQRIFATSSKYSGNLSAAFNSRTFTSGLAGADARCQWHADQASLGGTWRAVLGVASKSIKVHVPIFGGIHNLKGERIAANTQQLWNGPIENNVKYDENGTLLDDVEGGEVEAFVWSGSLSNGKADQIYNCSNFSSTSGIGRQGSTGKGTDHENFYQWITGDAGDCSTEAHLYCAEYVGEEFPTPTLTATAASTVGLVDVSVNIGEVSKNMKRLSIFRETGSNFLNNDCDSSYGSRFVTALTMSATSETAIADKNFQDSVDTRYPYNDNASGEHGYYHYYACAIDAYGNINSVSEKANVTVGTDWLNAFLSNNTFTGATVSIGAANTECSNSASANSIAGTFKAYLSNNSTSAISNIGTTNDRLIFDLAGNYMGYIEDGYMQVSGAVKTFGDQSIAPVGTSAWTGSYAYGTAGSHCSNWSSSSSVVYGSVLLDTGRNNNIGSSSATCDTALPVVCVKAN